MRRHTIAVMTRADLEGVMIIERTVTSPWKRGQFLEELAAPHGWQFTAFSPDSRRVSGYICGMTVADESEIRKIAVAERERRRGIAGSLLKTAFSHIKGQGVTSCFLELRQSNTAALNLYLANHFQEIGLRKSYYTKPAEHAIILQKQFNVS